MPPFPLLSPLLARSLSLLRRRRFPTSGGEQPAAGVPSLAQEDLSPTGVFSAASETATTVRPAGDFISGQIDGALVAGFRGDQQSFLSGRGCHSQLLLPLSGHQPCPCLYICNEEPTTFVPGSTRRSAAYCLCLAPVRRWVAVRQW